MFKYYYIIRNLDCDVLTARKGRALTNYVFIFPLCPNILAVPVLSSHDAWPSSLSVPLYTA